MNPEKHPSHQKTIFIVEDNELYAKSLQTYIQSISPQVKEVKFFRIGELCIRELNSNPDIVIMDYYLNSKYPEALNGLEIIKQIKTLKPKTNILVLSAQEKMNVALEAIKQYNCHYIQKDEEAFKKVKLYLEEM